MKRPASRKARNIRVISRFSIFRELMRGDREHDNIEHAIRYARNRDEAEQLTLRNSRQRILLHYAPIHGILRYLTREKLKGKKILHLAGSTGVYAHFLQRKYGAHVINLDMNHESLIDARRRGGKMQVEADAISQKKWDGQRFKQTKSGLLIPDDTSHHLPFKNKSFDFVISDHFLYSNYAGPYIQDHGFEEKHGSFRRSEEVLHELNRVMKKNGVVIIGEIHGKELTMREDRGPLYHPDNLARYRKGYRIHGFVVEEVLNDAVRSNEHSEDTRYMVLRKKEDEEY